MLKNKKENLKMKKIKNENDLFTNNTISYSI
jgi:hypothetical protein